MNSTAETLLDLPNEVITEVYQNLDVFGFLSARQTCRRMYEISDQASIWKILFTQLTKGSPTGLTKILENCSDDDLKRHVLGYISSHGRWKSNPRPVVRHMAMKNFMSRLPGTGCDRILLPGGRWMLTRTTAADYSSIVYVHDLDAAIPTSREILKLPTTSRILLMVRIPGAVPLAATPDTPAAFYFALIGLNLSAVSPGREATIYIFAFRPGHSPAVVHIKTLRSPYNIIDPGTGPLFQDSFLLQTVSPTTLQITNWYSLSRTESMTLLLRLPQKPLPRTTRLLSSGRTLLSMQLSQREIGVQLCVYDLPEYDNGWATKDGRHTVTLRQLKPTWVIDVPDSSGFDLHSDNLNLSSIQRPNSALYTRLALRVCSIVYGVVVPDDPKLTPSISILSILPGLGQVKSGLIAMGIDKLFVSQGACIHQSFVSFSWPDMNGERLALQQQQQKQARPGPWNGLAPYGDRVSVMDEVSGRVVTNFKVRTTPPRHSGNHLLGELEGLEELRLTGLPHEPIWSVLDLAAPEYLSWKPEDYNVTRFLHVDPSPHHGIIYF